MYHYTLNQWDWILKCYNPIDLKEAIDQALQLIEIKEKPVVVEVIINQDEIPPTMGRQ